MPPASSSADWPCAAAGQAARPAVACRRAPEGRPDGTRGGCRGRLVRPRVAVFVRSRGNVRGSHLAAVSRRGARAAVAVARMRRGLGCLGSLVLGGQGVGVHVHDHLIPIAGRALVEPARQRAFGHRAQRIGPPLRDGRGEAVRGVLGRRRPDRPGAAPRPARRPAHAAARRPPPVSAGHGPPPSRRRPPRCGVPGTRAGAGPPRPRPARSTRRQVRTTCSTCAAVPASATSSSACSVSGVATRVTARTFE